MNNYTGKLALYVEPKTALEVIQNLKADCPAEDRELFLKAIGGITERDLIFYELGKSAASREYQNKFRSILGKRGQV